MKTGGIRQQIVDEICILAQKYHVQKVILFGSRARGDYKRTSDFDLAVKGGELFAEDYIKNSIPGEHDSGVN